MRSHDVPNIFLLTVETSLRPKRRNAQFTSADPLAVSLAEVLAIHLA
jgi:hypothetical protein